MYKKMLFAVVLISAMVLVSCKNENPMHYEDNPAGMMSNMEDGESRLDSQIDKVDLETAFGFGMMNDEKEDMKKDYHQKSEKRRGMMIKKLGLTDEQIELMKSAKEEMKACSEEGRSSIKAIIESEFTAANSKRDEIIASMKSGEISKDEAKELLKTLKSDVKESIKSNEEIVSYKAELKLCHEEMKAKVEGILTAEQLEKMKEMKGKHKNGKHRKNK